MHGNWGWLVLVVAVVGVVLGLIVAQPPSGPEVLRSARPRASPQAVAPADLRSVVAGNTAFALRLYRQMAAGARNFCFSPHSAYVALAMTYAGARGETEREMAAVLGFRLSQEQLHRALGALELDLAASAGTVELTIANALWAQRGYPFRSEYLDLLAEHYGAGVQLVDFARAADAARRQINAWVSKETRGRIQDLLSPGAVSPLTTLVLTNAIYFRGAWEEAFQAAGLQPFYPLEGGEVLTPMMRTARRLWYAAGPDWQTVELPYRGGEFAMVVIVPSRGAFLSFERALGPELLERVVGALEPRSVELVMPKFSLESAFSLRETLAQLGMGRLFTGAADFSGIDGGRGLFLTDVVHKALVSVTEEGTEVAAATAVIVERAMPVEVRADRPFAFFIYHRRTGMVLFLGRLVRPEGA